MASTMSTLAYHPIHDYGNANVHRDVINSGIQRGYMTSGASRAYNTTVAQDNSHVIQGDVVHHHYYPSTKTTLHFPVSIPLEWQQSNRYDLLVESLKFPRMHARSLNIEEAADETCVWLLSNQAYLDWVNDNHVEVHHGFLWIKGKPGSGKSTIMKFLLEQSTKRQQDLTISYFFNSRALTDLEKSSQGLYRSLAHQLLMSLPLASIEFATRFWSKVSSDAVDEWTSMELQGFITHLVANLDRPAVNILIDALDEGMEDDVRRFVSYIEKLLVRCRVHPARLRIIFSSRHFPHITSRYGSYLVLDQEPEHDKDIKTFVQQALQIDSEPLRDQVCVRSAGIFLWIVLTVPMLNTEYDQGADLDDLESILKNLPTDLNELFENILRTSRVGIDECVTLLQWVLFSKEPLTPRELYVALHYSQSTGPPKASSVPDEDRLQKYLLHRSRGLVEIVKSEDHIVQFIHETVRAFLLGPEGLCKIQPALTGRLSGLSHDKLKRACFEFIKHNKAGYQSVVRQVAQPVHSYIGQSVGHHFWPGFSDETFDGFDALPPFAEYALNMFYHANMARSDDISQDNWLSQLDGSNELRVWSECFVFMNDWEYLQQIPTQDPPLFVIAAHLKLTRLFRHLIALLLAGSHATSSNIETALTIAYGNADLEQIANIVSILEVATTEYESDRNAQQRVLDALFQRGLYVSGWVLSSARDCGLTITTEDIVRGLQTWATSPWDIEGLFDLGVKPDCRDIKGVHMSSVAWGRYIDAEDICSLVEAGGKLNQVVDDLGGALHATCFGECNVKLLLDAGADPNVQGGIYGNALQALCWLYPEEFADASLLIEAGADVNAVSGVWGTALQAAAARGTFRMLELLLEAGADVNLTGGSSGSALEAASRHNSGSLVIERLIEAGAYIRPSYWRERPLVDSYKSLLHRAFEGSHVAKVNQLLNLIVEDDPSWTPLLRALHVAILRRDKELIDHLCKHNGGHPPDGFKFRFQDTDFKFGWEEPAYRVFCGKYNWGTVRKEQRMLRAFCQQYDWIKAEKVQTPSKTEKVIEDANTLPCATGDKSRTSKFRSPSIKVDELELRRNLGKISRRRMPFFATTVYGGFPPIRRDESGYWDVLDNCEDD